MSGSNLHPEDIKQLEMARSLEREWGELDKLMDELSCLWQSVGGVDNDEQQDVVDIDSQSDEEKDRSGSMRSNTARVAVSSVTNNPFDDSHALGQQQQRAPTISTWTPMTPAPDFDQQTLDMAALDDLPHYDDVVPQYQTYEKSDKATAPIEDQSRAKDGMTRVSNRTGRVHTSTIDDEKTRYDLNNVMEAIDRLSKVAPRMDNQRVHLSPSQRRQMVQANIAGAVDQLSKNNRRDKRMSSVSSSSAVHRRSAVMELMPAAEKSRDLNKLMSQIAESAKAGFSDQRAEFSPRQQWKLEGARIGDTIERGGKMRLKDQVRR
jgi:hypothetical protein